MSTPLLVLVTGPIASGKTTTARTLAQRRCDVGQAAASLDLDDFVQIVAGSDWTTVRPNDWLLACRAAAAAARALFEAGVRCVFLAGPFFSRQFRQQFHELLRFECESPCVLLDVSLEETIRRAAADDARRVLTKDPDFVRKIYATIVWDELPADAIRVDSERLEMAWVLDAIEHAIAAAQEGLRASRDLPRSALSALPAWLRS